MRASPPQSAYEGRPPAGWFLDSAVPGGRDPAAGLDLRDHLFAVRELARRHQHPRTRLGQPHGDVATDPAASPGHEDRAARKVEESADVHGRGYDSRESTNQLFMSRPLRAAEPIVTCSETPRRVSTMKPYTKRERPRSFTAISGQPSGCSLGTRR